MLEGIGLTTVESRMYQALIDNPRLTAAELAPYCDASTGLAAHALAGLVRRGMASRLPGKRARYIAVAPDVAIQPILGRREDELHEVRTAVHTLMTAYHQTSRHTHPAELVEVVSGGANIISRALAMQDGARTTMRAIVMDPIVMPADHNFDRERQRIGDGLEYQALYDSRLLPHRLEDIRRSVRYGERARVAVDPPLKLWIADDTAALIPYGFDAAFVVHPSVLLDALLALFDLEWDRATPLRFRPPQRTASPAGEPSEATRTLLALLAAGITDEGIARSLGLSLRTLQRRIQDVMRELNVTTRFQAGMAAREREWV